MNYVFQKKKYILPAAFLDKLTGFFYKPLKKINYLTDSEKPRKILIARLDHLGDVLTASAFPQALKEAYPEAQVIFLTNTPGRALLQNNPYINKIIEFNPGWYGRSGHGKAGDLKFIIKTLKKEKIDLSLAPRGDIRENYLLWKTGIKTRVGYSVTGGACLLTHEPEYNFNVHESEHSKALMKMLGISIAHFNPRIYWSPGEEREIQDVLNDKGFKSGVWIGVQVDAGTSAKQWPMESYRAFLDCVSREMPEKKIIFLGQDLNRGDLCQALIDEFKKHDRWLNMVGRVTLRQLIYLISRCRIFIGPDSGPGHIAVSFGIPTLMLYSGTNVFQQWKPLAEHAYVLSNPVACAPCRKKICSVPGHPCMAGISPESVFDWLKGHSRELF